MKDHRPRTTPGINEVNQDIEQYFRDITLKGFSQKTIASKRYRLYALNRLLSKPLQEWKKEEIDNHLFNMHGRLKPTTIENTKTDIIAFFKHINQAYKVEHLTIIVHECPLKKEDILTVDDINLLIKSTNSPLYQAIIVFLFESGARISEVLEMRVSDITETPQGMVAYVHQTKYGKDLRPVLCIRSAKYIRRLIAYMDLPKTSYLFPSPKLGGTGRVAYEANDKEHLHYNAIDKNLKKIAKRAGITKPVHCHVFRHACTDYMLTLGYNEATIKKELGWKPASRAIDRYTHMNHQDVFNARLAKEGNGGIQPQQPIATINDPEELEVANNEAIIKKLVADNKEKGDLLKGLMIRFNEMEKTLKEKEAQK